MASFKIENGVALIPEGTREIPEQAFKGCTSLKSIVIPKGIKFIRSRAFMDCSSLTEVVLPEGLINIEHGAFEHCHSLESISIPNGVTGVGYSAFSGCSSLKSIVLPMGLKHISTYAFCDCSSLTSITIPTGVKSIEGSAFLDCSSLESVTLPDGLSEIKQHAFSSCSSLSSITIPKTVWHIETEVFKACSSLTSIVVEDGNTRYDSRDNGTTLYETLTNTLIHDCAKTISEGSMPKHFLDSEDLDWDDNFVIDQEDSYEGKLYDDSLDHLPTIEQTIIRCLVDKEHVDSPDRITVLEPLRLQVQAEYHLWHQKASYLKILFNQALTTDQHNATTEVALEQIDDNNFVITLTPEYKPYYVMFEYDSDIGRRTKIATSNEAMYLEVIDCILHYYEDNEQRLDAIEGLLESGYWEDYCIRTIYPKYCPYAFDALLFSWDMQDFKLIRCDRSDIERVEALEEAVEYDDQMVIWLGPIGEEDDDQEGDA